MMRIVISMMCLRDSLVDACRLICMGAIADEGGMMMYIRNPWHLWIFISRLRDSLVDACKLIGMGAIIDEGGVRMSIRNPWHLWICISRLRIPFIAIVDNARVIGVRMR